MCWADVSLVHRKLFIASLTTLYSDVLRRCSPGFYIKLFITSLTTLYSDELRRCYRAFHDICWPLVRTMYTTLSQRFSEQIPMHVISRQRVKDTVKEGRTISEPPSQRLKWLWCDEIRSHKNMCHYYKFMFIFSVRDSSVVIALGYELDHRSSTVRFPTGAWNFSLHHRVQNGSGAHPAFYPVGARGSFPGDKAAVAWSWSLSSI
jgi:hypothetical protein